MASLLGRLGRGKTILLLTGAAVALVIIFFAFAPWSYFLGGQFHILPYWQGYGVLHSEGQGDYTVYVHLSPRITRPRRSPHLGGYGYLCTPHGERFRMYATADMPGDIGIHPDGQAISIAMRQLSNDPQPSIRIRGRWVGEAIVGNDDKSLASSFDRDGSIHRGHDPNRPAGAELIPVTLTQGNVSDFNSACAVLALNASSTGSSQVSPIKASENGRYLVDQRGTPFLLMGDSPWDMLQKLSASSITYYMATRQSQGYNAILIDVLCGTCVSSPTSGSTSFDETQPFTTGTTFNTYDVSTPNPAYFAELDTLINMAGRYNLQVLVDPLDNYNFMTTLEKGGATKAYNYGVYLGNRYKNVPNVIWFLGNDFQNWNSNATDNGLFEKVMQGIVSADPNHLMTDELNYNMSGSLQDPTLVPYTTMAGSYTYYPVYYQTLQEYNSSATKVPVFMEESYYEAGFYGNLTPTVATQAMLRSIAYETILSGGLGGYLYGTAYYDFHSGWERKIHSPGVTYLGYWKRLFSNTAWYRLVPDQNHSIVTAGYGRPTGNNSGDIQHDNYVTTASSPDGSLIVSYIPQPSTITVNMTTMRGPVTARWYDPTNGSFRTVSGSPFPNSGARNFSSPGRNNAGDSDWVLVLTN